MAGPDVAALSVARSFRASPIRPSSISASRRVASAPSCVASARTIASVIVERAGEVVERVVDRRLERLRPRIVGDDRDRGSGGVEGLLLIAEICREPAAPVVQDGEVRRADEVVRVGREVLRPGSDRMVDLGDRAGGWQDRAVARRRHGRGLGGLTGTPTRPSQVCAGVTVTAGRSAPHANVAPAISTAAARTPRRRGRRQPGRRWESVAVVVVIDTSLARWSSIGWSVVVVAVSMEGGPVGRPPIGIRQCGTPRYGKLDR